MARVTRDTPDIDAALAELRRRFAHRANVTGFDQGYRWTDGKQTKEVCVRIHVTDKIPDAELRAGEAFPNEILGVKVDVLRGRFRANPQAGGFASSSRRSVSAGMACWRRGGGQGTIGAIVIDERTGASGLLSNWHVLHGAHGNEGDHVLVRGAFGGRRVGQLAQSILGSAGDAAFAPFTRQVAWLPIPVGLSAAPTATGAPALGQRLLKSGATTQVTKAHVDGIGSYRVAYETTPGQREMVEIKGFVLRGESDDAEISLPGDSGSCWLDPSTGAAIGLHVGGEDAAGPDEFAVACHMSRVLDKLGLRLATIDDFDAGISTEVLSEAGEFAGNAGLVMPAAGSYPAQNLWPWHPCPRPFPMPPYVPTPTPIPYPYPPTGPGPDPGPYINRRRAEPGFGQTFTGGETNGQIGTELQVREMSVAGDIWPLMSATAVAAVQRLGWRIRLPLEWDGELGRVLGPDWYFATLQLVGLSPLASRLADDQIRLRAAIFRDAVTFGDVANKIAATYAAAGWWVTS
jgi:hypothetical protein